MLAEGRIRWGYWPPGADESVIRAVAGVEGAGIWIPGQDAIDEEEDDEYDVENPKNQRFMRLGTFSILLLTTHYLPHPRSRRLLGPRRLRPRL